jgi:hypothetical protein
MGLLYIAPPPLAHACELRMSQGPTCSVLQNTVCVCVCVCACECLHVCFTVYVRKFVCVFLDFHTHTQKHTHARAHKRHAHSHTYTGGIRAECKVVWFVFSPPPENPIPPIPSPHFPQLVSVCKCVQIMYTLFAR